MPDLAPAEGSRPLTFLFTDIEGSTRIWDEHPEAMRAALLQHDDLLRACIESHGGRVFKTMGDAFCAVFTEPRGALETVLASQQWLPALCLSTPEGNQPLKVRMALHTGVVEERDGDYFGQPLNRVARLLATGHGGQVLLSAATRALLGEHLPAGVTLQDRGSHRLRDLSEPEQVFQLLHPDLVADFPPLRSLSTHLNNLPQQLTSFIGREREIAELRGLLEKTRLLTLTGSGGCGKTRLALQVGAEALEQIPDGVWLVELAPLSDPALVPQSVASALGLKEEPGKSLTRTVVECLQSKQLLLLLDNCEHLLEACARLADAVLRGCPGARVLATSREGLAIGGEMEYRVPSLPAPDPQRDATPEAVERYEAVRLFVERAQDHQPQFGVTNRNAPAVGSICHRLDGIPLAIELAAARVRAMPVEQIEQRLDQRFRLLTGGSRTALPRQQTLRSLIDWSYDLLTGPEQTLLRRLSVFAGGWTLDAAEGVTGDGVASGESGTDLVTRHASRVTRVEVLDLLTALVDKSLVVYEEALGVGRYRLLETVRHYAGERMEGTERAGVRGRHGEYYLFLAEAMSEQLNGPRQIEAVTVLDVENENLRAALDWFGAQSGGGLPGLRLCSALAPFWHLRGHPAEGRSRLGTALSHPGAQSATKPRAVALNGAGALAASQGEYALARALIMESLEIRHELDDRAGMATLLINLGGMAQEQGDLPGALQMLGEAVTICRGVGDRVGEGTALNNLGNAQDALGRYAEARALYEEALAIARALSDPTAVALTLTNLGLLAHKEGHSHQARAYHEEALALNRQVGDQRNLALTLNNLASLATQEGDFEAARAHLGDALSVSRATGDRRGVTLGLEGMAELAQRKGKSERAARLYGAVEALRQLLQTPVMPDQESDLTRRLVGLRGDLGGSAFAAAFDAGTALSWEDAIDLALSHDGPDGVAA